MESTPPENKNALKGQEGLRQTLRRVLLERWEPEGARRWLGSPFGSVSALPCDGGGKSMPWVEDLGLLLSTLEIFS